MFTGGGHAGGGEEELILSAPCHGSLTSIASSLVPSRWAARTDIMGHRGMGKEAETVSTCMGWDVDIVLFGKSSGFHKMFYRARIPLSQCQRIIKKFWPYFVSISYSISYSFCSGSLAVFIQLYGQITHHSLDCETFRDRNS